VNFNTVNNLDIESYVGTFSPAQLVYTKRSFPLQNVTGPYIYGHLLCELCLNPPDSFGDMKVDILTD
jgi:hypothetical protein